MFKGEAVKFKKIFKDKVIEEYDESVYNGYFVIEKVDDKKIEISHETGLKLRIPKLWVEVTSGIDDLMAGTMIYGKQKKVFKKQFLKAIKEMPVIKSRDDYNPEDIAKMLYEVLEYFYNY